MYVPGVPGNSINGNSFGNGTRSTTWTHVTSKSNPTGMVTTKTTTISKPSATPPPDTGTKSGPLPVGKKASECKFNLPPHSWSLPINPNNLNSLNGAPSLAKNGMRRAIMWYYGGSDITNNDNTAVPTGTASGTTTQDGTKYLPGTATDNQWGFQFLWNPTQLQTVLTRNANVVPSIMDQHAGLSGLFTAMEGLQFTIVIDRVNDFACFKGNPHADVTGYYTAGYPGVVHPGNEIETRFKMLMELGTMADIEYIYRMINGSGQKGYLWANALGRKTANLSFLAPTAIGLRLGPNPNSLSYVGWIENLNINHTMFTEDMIPLHSEVTVTFNAFSMVSLVSRNSK